MNLRNLGHNEWIGIGIFMWGIMAFAMGIWVAFAMNVLIGVGIILTTGPFTILVGKALWILVHPNQQEYDETN